MGGGMEWGAERVPHSCIWRYSVEPRAYRAASVVSWELVSPERVSPELRAPSQRIAQACRRSGSQLGARGSHAWCSRAPGSTSSQLKELRLATIQQHCC